MSGDPGMGSTNNLNLRVRLGVRHNLMAYQITSRGRNFDTQSAGWVFGLKIRGFG